MNNVTLLNKRKKKKNPCFFILENIKKKIIYAEKSRVDLDFDNSSVNRNMIFVLNKS